MKKITLFLISIFIFSGLNAQNVYSFQKSSGTYSAITGGTLVSGTSTWSPFASHTVPIGFSFNYFGNNYTNIYCEGSGFCVFDPALYYYTLHPYTVQMRDAGTGTSLSQSPISYKVDGTAPNRICKIQWQNCELQNDLGSYANFQLWLYETSNIIEARIGNCTVNNAAAAFQNNGFDGPLIGLYKTQGSPHYGYCVQGASPAETLLTINTGTTGNVFQNSMSAPPPNGTIYKFIPGSSVGVSEKNATSKLTIYPNPVKDVLKVNNGENNEYEIYSFSGALVKKGKLTVKNAQIEVSDILQGVYFLKINSDFFKIIKTVE